MVQDSVENVGKYVVEAEEISDNEMSVAMEDYKRSQSLLVQHPAHSVFQPAEVEKIDSHLKRPPPQAQMEEYAKKRLSSLTMTKSLWAHNAYQCRVEY